MRSHATKCSETNQVRLSQKDIQRQGLISYTGNRESQKKKSCISSFLKCYIFILASWKLCSSQVGAAVHQLSEFSCHWLYFSFVDHDPIHFTTIISNDLPQCFIHWSSLTHKQRALEMPLCGCLFHTIQMLSSSVTEYVLKKKKKNYLCLSIPQLELPGLLEDAEVSCLYRKEWFVSGWWGEKVRTLALQDPLAKRHSLPGIFSWPPAPITAFSKKMEGSRGRKIAWPQVGKSWQQRPGEDKGK